MKYCSTTVENFEMRVEIGRQPLLIYKKPFLKRGYLLG